MGSWIVLNTKIIERNDLNVFEKMCCVVLSMYADDTDVVLTSDFISERMGCSYEDGKTALDGLVHKGIIEFDQAQGDEAIVSGNVLKSSDEKISKLEEGFKFDALEEKKVDDHVIDKSNFTTLGKIVKNAYVKPEEKVKSLEQEMENFINKKPQNPDFSKINPTQRINRPKSNNKNIEKVYEIIDEKISEREAKIILSFAENNISKIKEKYLIAKNSQYNDKIEILINELQKPDESMAKTRIIKSQPNQIDHDKIEQLRKLSNNNS